MKHGSRAPRRAAKRRRAAPALRQLISPAAFAALGFLISALPWIPSEHMEGIRELREKLEG